MNSYHADNRVAALIRITGLLAIASVLLFGIHPAVANEVLSESAIAAKVVPPYKLGERLESEGVWSLVNLDGALAGYIFETEALASIPGFSGQPINMLVSMTTDGTLLKVELLHHNEPIFISGLGQAPFHHFVNQYSGLSIKDSLAVGVPYGSVDGASFQKYIDGVTKATASVRIAHESILAAAYAMARRKMKGINTGQAPTPDREYREPLSFDNLVAEGIAKQKVVTNAEVQVLFEGSNWESDDPQSLAAPEDPYLDLWIIDLGPPSVASAILDPGSLDKLNHFLSLSPESEPILLIEGGRHGLVSEDFVRNTEPDLIGATQDGLPVALRDADLEVSLLPGLPQGNRLLVRTDRRLGFNPTRRWELQLKVVRKHGSFMPIIGTRDLTVSYAMPKRFYKSFDQPAPPSPFAQAVLGRISDLIILGIFIVTLVAALLLRQNRIASASHYPWLRLGILALVIGFVGWWGQGQLSIATVLGVIGATVEQRSLTFLLYDPFSLLLWVTVFFGFVLWGRGLFCGWLCPYGAMQEFSAWLGEKLGLHSITLSRRWDQRLKKVKYLVLAGLVLMTVFAPTLLGIAIEVEPFKTAVTTYFVREWYFVLYAVFWLVLSMFLFKGFCRYLCPLGAFMAIGGLLRTRRWIDRRSKCGSPCQLCTVRCKYYAINTEGKIQYDECFHCLDCVTIYQDDRSCVPLVLASKGKSL